MVTIHLHHVLFFAYHGLFPSEKELGNQFEINLDVEYEEKSLSFEGIDQTIDYSELYTILKRHMEVATPLLESVCADILLEIKQRFPFVQAINISLFKMKPPIEDFNGKAGVSLRKKYNN